MSDNCNKIICVAILYNANDILELHDLYIFNSNNNLYLHVPYKSKKKQRHKQREAITIIMKHKHYKRQVSNSKWKTLKRCATVRTETQCQHSQKLSTPLILPKCTTVIQVRKDKSILKTLFKSAHRYLHIIDPKVGGGAEKMWIWEIPRDGFSELYAACFLPIYSKGTRETNKKYSSAESPVNWVFCSMNIPQTLTSEL